MTHSNAGAVKITTAMLDRLGSSRHDVQGCQDVREILAQGGVSDVQLSIYETGEINRLRKEAGRLTAMADAIEARGPWPANLQREGCER